MTIYEKKQAMLGLEFDRYVMEHPDFAAQIPEGAQIIIEMAGDEGFNAWARSLAERHREHGQPIVLVKVKGLLPAHSRLDAPTIEKIC